MKRSSQKLRKPARRKAASAAPAKVTRSGDISERIYDSIMEMATECHFRPGERINEVALSKQLSVSRTPIRQALNRLARDGFVYLVPNQGFISRDMSPTHVRDLYELRAAIERMSFRLACQRSTNEKIEWAVAKWEAFANVRGEQSWDDLAKADEEFHLAVATISENSALVEALRNINRRIRFYRKIDLRTEGRRVKTFGEHANLIKFLRARDWANSGDLVERHISLSWEHAEEITKEGLARVFFRRQPTTGR